MITVKVKKVGFENGEFVVESSKQQFSSVDQAVNWLQAQGFKLIDRDKLAEEIVGRHSTWEKDEGALITTAYVYLR